MKYKEKEDQEREIQKESKTAYISKQVKRGKRFKISRPVDYPRKGKSAYLLFVSDKKERAKVLFEGECKAAKTKYEKKMKQGKEWKDEKIWELNRIEK